MKTIIIILTLSLTGCIEGDVSVDPVEVDIPDLPCFDGWQYDFIGQPILDPYGAQLTC